MPEPVHQPGELFLSTEHADACRCAVTQDELHAVRMLRFECCGTGFTLSAQRFNIRMYKQDQSLSLNRLGKCLLLFRNTGGGGE